MKPASWKGRRGRPLLFVLLLLLPLVVSGGVDGKTGQEREEPSEKARNAPPCKLVKANPEDLTRQQLQQQQQQQHRQSSGGEEKEEEEEEKSKWTSLRLNGKKFRYKERSVVVICQNLSATDIQKLIPACSDADGERGNRRGPCMSMTNLQRSSPGGKEDNSVSPRRPRLPQGNSLLSLLSSGQVGGRGDGGGGEEGNQECQGQDVGCKLLKKIRRYLGERLKGAQGISRLLQEYAASTARTTTTTTRRPPPKPFILLVLLPCKERDGGRKAKIWLKRLQALLRRRRSHISRELKVVTVYSCKEEHKQKLQELLKRRKRQMIGVLAFNDRGSELQQLEGNSSAVSTKPETSSSRTVSLSASPCNEQSQNLLKVIKLRKALMAAPEVSIVYSYSHASAGAMRLLAGLIVDHAISVQRVTPAYHGRPLPPPSAGTTLYLGGTGHKAECAAFDQEEAELRRLDRAFASLIRGGPVRAAEGGIAGGIPEEMERDCQCRTWGFQFLTMRPPKPPPPPPSTTTTTASSTSSSATTETSVPPSVPSSVSSTEADTTTATEDYYDEYYDTTEYSVVSEGSPSSTTLTTTTASTTTSTTTTTTTTATTTTTQTTSTTTISRSTTLSTTRSTTSTTTTRMMYTMRPGLFPVRVHEAEAEVEEDDVVFGNASSNQNLEQNVRSNNGTCYSEQRWKTWQLLSLGLSVAGILCTIVAFATYATVLLKTAASRYSGGGGGAVRLHRFELLPPLGFVLLYLGVAVFGVQASWVVCLLRRTLPGLGFACAFSGLILQMSHDLNKNVYTVNPDLALKCGLSREDGLFLLGAILVVVQAILSAAWNVASPPEVQQCHCQKMTDFQETFFYSLSYPVFLGVVICALSALSLKWRTNSGALGNILAVLTCFATWSCASIVQETLAHDGDRSMRQVWLYLACYAVPTTFLLLLAYLRRMVARFRSLMSTRTDLQLTSNISISDNNLNCPGGGGLEGHSVGLSASSMLAGLGSFGRNGGGNGLSRGGVPPEFSRGNPAYDVVPNRAHLPSSVGGRSHNNRDYMNTFSSTSSFTLPSIIAMPESSTWQDICRWEFSEEYDHDEVIEEEEEEEDARSDDEPEEEDPDDDEYEDEDDEDLSGNEEQECERQEQTGTLRANRVIHRISAEEEILSNASDVVQTDRENRIVMLKSSSITGISNI